MIFGNIVDFIVLCVAVCAIYALRYTRTPAERERDK